VERFLKDYLYYKLSPYLYEYDCEGIVDFSDDSKWIEIDEGDTGRRMNMYSIKIEWIVQGKQEAREQLSRSKYRRLCKRVDARFRKLNRSL